MSASILRPIFSENQILSAADINTIVSHSQGADTRHNQYLHQWGIAHGLDLVANDREDTTGQYAEVVVQPGMAIDGAGREIVVTEAISLREFDFDQLQVENKTGDVETNFYPVFLIGRDKRQQDTSTLNSLCEAGGPNRVNEHYELTFGRVGDAADLDDQVAPTLGEDASASGPRSWRILLGFVTWDGARTPKRFMSAVAEHDGVGRRYAGVRGAELTGLDDSVTMRSAERAINDKAALVIDNENGGEMRFGLQDSRGKVVPVFTVNAEGDVRAEGRILGAIAGSIQIESGVITDGMEVPLPAGFTQDMVDTGKATIQVQLTPRYDQPTTLPPPALATSDDHWLMHPLSCYADGRRVVCTVRWDRTDDPAGSVVLPGVCDYIVTGYLKPEQEGS
jgi:hypothetical protein